MDHCDQTNKNHSTETNTELKVEFLFLNENQCKPCNGTSAALAQAIEMLRAPLKTMGIGLKLEKIHVNSKEIALARKFRSSPTIRINGKDIDPARTEDICPSCGTLTGDTAVVSCRTWHWKDEVYQVAPAGKIIEEIFSAVAAMPPDTRSEGCCDDTDESSVYTLPENLKGFFDAIAKEQ